MAVGKLIEKRGHVTGFKEEIAKAATASEDDFFTWFDAAKDKDAAFVKGSWDFMVHVGHPAFKYIRSPETKIALEIGYGGGRLLAAASSAFRRVIGVDIHENASLVEKELQSQGVTNFDLLLTKGNEIPVPDSSVDFVYSFIVLQHVEKMDVFVRYLRETHRVLKDGGVAVLYFGRKKFLSRSGNSRLAISADTILERVLVPSGYEEVPARVNCINLFVTLSKAKRVAREAGFSVKEQLVSYRLGGAESISFGSQHGILLIK